MKILILTQKVDKNDSNLGFFHRWIEEFAKNCEKVIVICLYKGKYNLPENVKVLSLGKENGVCRLKYLFNFYKYIFKYRKKYDAVFVHMNQIYVILGGLFWKLMNKKTALWYTHKNISLSLRLATKITNIIFTASKKSFRLPSKKIKVMGHGIDTEKFCPAPNKCQSDFLNIVTIGRISLVKRYEDLISVIGELCQNDKFHDKLKVNIVGGVIDVSGEEYFSKLKNLVETKKLKNVINFTGPVSHDQVVDILRNSDLFIHMSQTGSLDKAVLEAMACGVLVLSNNESVVNDIFKNDKFFCYKENNELLSKIENIINLDEEKINKFKQKNRQLVVYNHDLSDLIKKILINFNEKADKRFYNFYNK